MTGFLTVLVIAIGLGALAMARGVGPSRRSFLVTALRAGIAIAAIRAALFGMGFAIAQNQAGRRLGIGFLLAVVPSACEMELAYDWSGGPAGSPRLAAGLTVILVAGTSLLLGLGWAWLRLSQSRKDIADGAGPALPT